jgi:acetyltransferase
LQQAGAAFYSIHENILKFNPRAVIKGIYIQKMITDGEEVILGVKRDPSFGPVIMFGLGGLFVEVFKDVSFRIAPVGPISAGIMIRDVKSYPILSGARGKKPRDIKSIEECIQRLSALALDCPQIQELDVNPLIVNDEGMGCFVADARILL